MTKRTVNAREALKDIRNGMDDLQLMEKYKINDRGLGSLFRKLVAAGLLTQADVEIRQSPFLSTVTLEWDPYGLLPPPDEGNRRRGK